MVLLELAIFPNDKGTSLSPYVARVMDIIDKSGLTYQFSAMSTTIEGEWDDVQKVVGDCFTRANLVTPAIALRTGFRWRKPLC